MWYAENMVKNSGQLTILVLLLAMLTLVGGLSVATRSLSDLKQVTFVDSGTKALAAAELGLQYAFANQNTFGSITPPGSGCSSKILVSGLTLAGIDNSSVKYQICRVSQKSVTAPAVAKDDVLQVDLSNVSGIKGFDVSWRGQGAVEIEVVDKSANGNYYVRRYGYNSSLKPYDNGFITARPGTDCVISERQAACDTSSGGTYDSCTGYGEVAYQYVAPLPDGSTTLAKLIRVRPLYAAADVLVCAQNTTDPTAGFGLDSYQITAVAKALDGSTKKIQAAYYPSALPAIFDNVLYSGGSISK